MSAGLSQPVRHLILDRDGVLNHEAPAGGYVTRAEDFQWLPGALAALVLLSARGVRLSVVSNQSAVGRGLMSAAQLEAVDARMRAEAAAAGAPLAAVLYCPHAPQAGCSCRKPAPGLLQEAMARAGIGPAATLAVGDDARDLQAAQRAGIGALLVRTGKGRRTEAQIAAAPVAAYDDLLQLAQAIAEES
jgi:D-glycero-D-manno-heptose 1,7-bisphosphate phosphatase